MAITRYTLPAVAMLVVLAISTASVAVAQAPAGAEVAGDRGVDEQTVRKTSEGLVAAYNAGDAEKLVSLFLPNAELVDDAGNVYRGSDQITAIYRAFNERFPEAKMTLDIDSVRLVGTNIAIEDGFRTVVTGDREAQATNRYTMVYVKQDGDWKIASAREFAADPEPTPHDRLQALEWLVGNWVDEDATAAISIACNWAENDNFLLIDFVAKVEGETVMQSRQRVGWDPLARRIRSWVFDSDGGYGDGQWTEMNGHWVIKSTAVLPNGDTGSATIFLEPSGQDKFVMKGFDRVLGSEMQPDFEAVIVRKPPEPSK